MSDESKPPMRQIAELIDGIATARAEGAESLLTMCEHQLTLARRDTSDLRSILDDQSRGLDDRDAEIKRLNEAFDSEKTLRRYREEQLRLLHEDYASGVRESVRAIADRDAEIAKLRAELAEARERIAAFEREVENEASAAFVAPPAADPRVDAIGRLLVAVAERLGMESEMSKDRWDWVHDAFKARR